MDTGGVVVADVVLETWDAVGFEEWPIADVPGGELLVLSGRMSSEDVGTAMAVIWSYNGIPCEGGLTDADLERHLTETEGLVAPGGLRFRDTGTGSSVAPGCCFGLESWREWWDVVQGETLWLGHAPAPQVTHVGDVVRLSQDEGEPPSIDMSRDELSELLRGARQDLSGFLDRVHVWAATTVPEAAERLVSALGEYLHISGTEGKP